MDTTATTSSAPLGIAPGGIPNANPSNPNQNNPLFAGLGQNQGADNGFRIQYIPASPATLPISSGTAASQTRASELTQGQTVTDLNGNPGIVNFDPNTGLKLSAGQVVNTPVPATVSAPSTITSASLKQSAPIQLPPATTNTSNVGVLGAVDASTQALNDAKAADQAAAAKVSDSGNSYLATLAAIGDANGAGKLAIDNANNVSGLKANLDDIGTQIEAEKKSAQDQVTAIQQANIGGGSAASMNAQIGRVQSQSASRLADLAIIQNSANNKYSTAASIADQQLQAKLAPLQTALQAQQFMYTNNKDLQTQAHADFLAQQTRNYNQVQQDLTDVKNVKLEAAKNGAPVSVINALSNANNLNQALQVGGKYLSDPVAKALQLANLQHVQLENGKLINDAKANNSAVVPLQNTTNGSTVSVPTNVSPYVNFSSKAVPYADLSAAVGTAAEKTALVNSAQAAGLKVILNKNTAADLSNIKDANSKLDTIQSTFQNITQPNWVARALGGAFGANVAKIAETNPQKAAADSLSATGLDLLKGISGVQGFRGNATVVAQINSHLPTITDTAAVAQQKVDYIRTLLDDRENALVGNSQSNASSAGTVNLQDPKTGEVRAFSDLSASDLSAALKQGYIQK